MHSDVKGKKPNRMLRQRQVNNGKKPLAPSKAGGMKKGDSVTRARRPGAVAEQKPEQVCAVGAGGETQPLLEMLPRAERVKEIPWLLSLPNLMPSTCYWPRLLESPDIKAPRKCCPL